MGGWWGGPVGLSGPGWGAGVERGAGPAYRGGGDAGESAGVVFISPTTITAAQLLLTLTDPHTTTTTKPALRQRWLQKLFDKNQTQPRPQHANGPPDTATTPTRRINNALSALEKLGGIHRDHNQITITNRIILTKITNL